MLDEPTPADVDPTGKDYGFEVGASKTTGGNGFADVFKRGHFGWEYKGTKANLDTAFAQLQRYAIALDNPPLLIVSDIGTTIRIHTNWTNSVSKVYEIAIADLGDPEKRGWLKAALSDPEALRPSKTRQQLTEEVAGEFAELARLLRQRGHDAEQVAHFINRLVFCMFAEDVKLLPDNMFTRMLERALEDPSEFESFARDLFTAMKSGGRVGFEKVEWFNGGLFNDDLVFSLSKDEISIVHRAAKQYWGDIDPSILGTLFERGLDPDKRSQLGAHYTDREKIMMIVNPVIVEPLTAEWEKAKAEISGHMEKAAAAKGGTRTRSINQAQAVLDAHLQRLADYRVLDPACGSGNFLYLALLALKDLEHRAQVEAEALGLPRGFPRIGPEVVKGIEINPFAAELARVSVWIGEIQWMLKNGFAASGSPILKPLATIECRDALMTWQLGNGEEGGAWVEASWPNADVIIGNPPFLGDKKMRVVLGTSYTLHLRGLFSDRLKGRADLVSYWFAKAHGKIITGETDRVGLVATNSIKQASNRHILAAIRKTARIFSAWTDQPWTVDGAAVMVDLVCFERKDFPTEDIMLNGMLVSEIYDNLSSGSVDLSRVTPLRENAGIAFQGIKRVGSFDVDGELARQWLRLPINPNGRSNTDVMHPWASGFDVIRRSQGRWIIDFGWDRSLADVALYEAPFAYLDAHVRPARVGKREARANEQWWVYYWPRPEMRRAIAQLERYIATPSVSKHRLFRFIDSRVVPDGALAVIARSDFTTFGVAQSKFHLLWAGRAGSTLEDRPAYTPTTTFETFPFPEGLTPDIPAADYADDPRAITIAGAAARLNELRENWLNPPDLVKREPEVVPGYPDRILPINEEAAQKLKKRTLTNLYNECPAWLQNAHKALDEAVAAAYGWPADLSDDEILARLFELNQERAAKQP